MSQSSTKAYQKALAGLNSEQRQAVDQLDGPVLVVAGPGTGKTELLATRVAHILKTTDTAANQILCLTFTDNAAKNMRERISGLIGADAQKVAIHTFHSLGSEIINRFPEYFFEGADMQPADEVAQREIVENLLRKSDHDNPLRRGIGSEFSQLTAVCGVLDTIKRAGLTPEELAIVLDEVEAQIEIMEPLVSELFGARLDMKQLSGMSEKVGAFPTSPTVTLPIPFRPVSKVIGEGLSRAIKEAEGLGKTAPVGAWRNKWLVKNPDGSWGKLKERNKLIWWRAICELYSNYETALHKAKRFDFADMIIQVIHALEHQDDLRSELQERWLYIMIDEFQDTNAAQLRLARLLADNPVHEGNPNLLVVGDDDQGIFKFQGAELDNITRFIEDYPNSSVVVLHKNYRSHSDLITFSRSVITQAEDRLEQRIESVNKELIQANSDITASSIHKHAFSSQAAEHGWIADRIKELMDAGTHPTEIAVIARTHSHLQALVPFLRKNGVPFSYDRQTDIRDNEALRQLIDMARLVQTLSDGKSDEANALAGRVLSHPMWQISHQQLWEWSSTARRQLIAVAVELEEENPIHIVVDWFIQLSALGPHKSLEHMLDVLMGNVELSHSEEDVFFSPFKNYYFSDEELEENASEYISNLSAIKLLRSKLREYGGANQLFVKDLLRYLDVLERTQVRLTDETPFVSHTDAVSLLTVHKAKGLEFQSVFVIGAQEEVWASAGRQGSRYLQSVPIGPAGDQLDDFLRLMFVAVTRAKQNLFVTAFTANESGTSLQPLLMLGGEQAFTETNSSHSVVSLLETSWQDYHPLPEASDDVILRPLLDQYQLSVTHLLNFLNVAEAGPKHWLLTNLLEFPQSKEPFFAYGTAMHKALEQGLIQFRSGHKPTVAELTQLFELALKSQLLEDEDFEYYLAQGTAHLNLYHKQRLSLWSKDDLPEMNFADQGVTIGEARLTGKLDRISSLDEKHLKVIDIKTGSPLKAWGRNTGTDGMKTWKYRLQLTFYKLLIDNSREFKGKKLAQNGELEFTQPDEHGRLHALELEITPEETQELQKLVGVVWKKIQMLDLPDTSRYGDTVSDNKQFIEDLMNGTI